MLSWLDPLLAVLLLSRGKNSVTYLTRKISLANAESRVHFAVQIYVKNLDAEFCTVSSVTFCVGVSWGLAGKDGKSWEMMGNLFLLVLRRKKGKQQGIWAARNPDCTGRTHLVLTTKWIMPCSLACWYQDSTKYVLSVLISWLFCICVVISWTSKQVPIAAPVASHTPLSLRTMWMAGTETCPGRCVSSVLWVTMSLVLIAEEKSCSTVFVASSPMQCFFVTAAWLFSPGKRGFI